MRWSCVVLVLVTMFAAVPAVGVAAIDVNQLDWSVEYIIDTSQDDFGLSQATYPRNNRGLALSPDGRYLYLGYNNSHNSAGEVRKIDLTVSDCIDASIAQVAGARGKSIAVDDLGNVYLAEGSSIKVYDADLSTLEYTISTTTKCEGVAVTRDAGTLYLYGTDRTNATLTKWSLAESAGAITGSTQIWENGISGASDLRGCEVDSSGRVWMADHGGDVVFRLNSNGTGLASVSLNSPMDISFDGDQAYVTRYTDRVISVLDADMNLVGSDISVPWGDLALDADGQSGDGALTGIAVLPGVGFYVANETGQTADEKSIYGRDDSFSGYDGGTYYTDLTHDDNDPVLFATSVPEPSALILFFTLLLGALGLCRRV